MKPQIRLPKRQLTDLAVIRDQEVEKLQAAVQKLRETKLAPLPSHRLEETLKAALESEAAEAVLRQVFALHALLAQANINLGQVFDGLSAALKPEQSEWTPAEYQTWQTVAPHFHQLCELEIIRLSAKALDLSYAHVELLRTARVLTDIRPIFNEDASAISGAVVAHTLLLRYDNIEGDHVLGLAVDEKDLRDLVKQCTRALQKANTARARLENVAKIPTIILGADGDE